MGRKMQADPSVFTKLADEPGTLLCRVCQCRVTTNAWGRASHERSRGHKAMLRQLDLFDDRTPVERSALQATA